MKLKKADTKLELFTFGDDPEDTFYCLVNLKISPDGLNVEKLKLSDPRNFDRMLQETGCILMLTRNEIDELIRRGDLESDDLHQSLYELCRREKIIE